jgi:hypothetical protein
VAVTVKVVVADGGRPCPDRRLRKSAELEVKLADAEAPEAPVITKPAGAEIRTESSDWVDASFVTVNVKAALASATALDGDTATAKHLPDALQVLEVAPAEGATSTTAPSTPAASTPKDTRAMLKPGFGTAHPFHLHQSRDMTASAD